MQNSILISKAPGALITQNTVIDNIELSFLCFALFRVPLVKQKCQDAFVCFLGKEKDEFVDNSRYRQCFIIIFHMIII